MTFRKYLQGLRLWFTHTARQRILLEHQSLLMGRQLVETIKNKKTPDTLADLEFKVFSQFGDDGIIQYLINNLEISEKTFIEFGVEDYREANTRFLMMNDNWSGLVMDGSKKNIGKILNSEYYWKFELIARSAFITVENINQLISDEGIQGDIGLLHIDIDGNDYWVWKAIDIVNPDIAIIEYNSVFGSERLITVPYNGKFNRTTAHYSNLYFGASLGALHHLAKEKGYAFIGCNSAGNNAYFVRRDKLNASLKELSLGEGFVHSKFRESRDVKGNLTYLTGKDRQKAIKGLSVLNVANNQIERL